METANYAVYNVSLSVPLSERVTAVSESPDPVQFLALLLNGPARDHHSALWLQQLASAGDWPRLFAFDVAYLDPDQKILVAASVGPGTEFPPLPEGVTSVLFLPDRRLEETKSTRGNVVRICAKAELTARFDSLSHSSSDPFEAQMQAQPRPTQPESLPLIAGPPEFVFEPFVGSLMYLPDAVRPVAQTTDYFLTHEEFPIPAELMRGREVLAEVGESFARPMATGRTAEVEVPHFFTAANVRFYDPVAAAEAPGETEDNAEAHKIGARPSHELPPALKAAILLMDEELRREKESQKERRRKKERTPKEKRGQAKKQTGQVDEQPMTATPNVQMQAPAPVEMPVAFEAAHVEETMEPPQIHVEEPASIPAAETSPVLVEETLEVHAEEESAAALVQESPEIPVEEATQVAAEVFQQVSEEETLQERTEAKPVEVAPAPEPEIVAALNEPVFEAPAISATMLEETTTEPVIEHIAPLEAIVPPAAEEIEPVPASDVVEAVLESAPVSEASPVLESHSEAPALEAVAETALPSPIAEPSHDITHEITESETVPFPEAAPSTVPESRKGKLSFALRFQRWLVGEEGSQRRKSERVAVPGLVAFYWSGGAPKPHEVVNISKNGFYIRTRELWLPDTLVRMTLQRPSDNNIEIKQSIRVLARVVRIDEDGVGHEFVTTEALTRMRTLEVLPEHGTSKKELEVFLGMRP